MSKIKKLIALTLALAMVLSVSAFAGSYKADTYVDAAAIDADCKSAIELLYALEIMKGDDKGQFRPTDGITRAEMAKMIYVILNYGDDDKAVTYKGGKFFTDVEAGYWAEGYINYCASTKLIAGRGDGTFDPTANVTTAEAAKMLLTAIGYSAEHRGYTGANWDKNVLADAAILGLLDGYKSNVNLVAPRQWVAVMVANALDCYTYGTMAPSFSGLLVSGTNVNNGVVEYIYDTMGEKYYGYKVYTGYIVAANGYEIDAYTLAAGVNAADHDFVLEIGDIDVALDGDVSIEDLGQQFKVIAIGSGVISMRNTGKSVVTEDEVKDVTYELAYGTSNNAASNKYIFTVGDESASVGSVKVLDVVYGNSTYTTEDYDALKTEIRKGAYRNDVVRAIDKDADGDFDYVVYTPVEYAVITKVATSQKYGEYVKATAADGTALTFKNGSNLYLKDVIICEDELAVDNIVKFTWNIDADKYNVEILDVYEALEFENRKVMKNEYTFEGNTYNLAANAFAGVDGVLNATGAVGDDYDVVFDGDLIVYAIATDDNYKSMDEVNAQLAVLIKADVRNSTDDNDKQVKLLTIDGETAWYAYDVAGAVTAEKVLTDAQEADVILKWSELMNDITINSDVEKDADWDQLVIVHTNKYGEVYLETIPADADLNLPTELVDNVTDKKAQLVVKEGTAKFGGTKIAADNQFFAKVEGEYCVITIADLVDGTYSGVDAQSLINESNLYYDTIVGGYYIIAKADPTTASGWLYVLDQEDKEYSDKTTVYVLFDNGEEKEIEVSQNVTNDFCYYYAFDGENYTLTFRWASKGNAYGDDEGTLWYGKDNSIDTSKYDTFAFKTTIYERTLIDDQWEWVAVEVIDEFITAEELAARVIEVYGADATNEYTYTIFDNIVTDEDNTCLFVNLDVAMNANQEVEGEN